MTDVDYDAVIVSLRDATVVPVQGHDLQLRRLLARLDVQVEFMAGVGGWTVRGTRSAIGQVRGSDGPLTDTEFQVEPDDTFASFGNDH
jgi:hypothetical protein